MKNKKQAAVFAAALLTLLSVTASSWAGNGNSNGIPKPLKYEIGVHTGIDLGGAVPYPLKEAIGGGNKMNASVRVSPAIGFSFKAFLHENWSLGTEITFKQVGIDAEAWVADQKFRDKTNPNTLLSFRGTAQVTMRFSMLEIPVVASYHFNDRHRVFLGGYYALILKGKFDSTPMKGMLVDVDDPLSVPILPTPESPYTQDFNNDLGSWDAGFLLGYDYRIFDRFNIGGRFSVGMKDIFKKDNKYFTYSMLHMRGSIVLSYMFFQNK